MPLSASDLARQLHARGQVAQAIATLQAAVVRNDPDALFQAALWRLIGDPLPRDLGQARSLLNRATTAGHFDAALMEVALTANGSGAPANWTAARRLLETAAKHDAVAAAQLRLVQAMDLAGDGAPARLPTPERLSPRIAVIRYRGLLTSAECAHCAETVTDLLQPATVADPVTGRMIANPIRTSDSAVIGPTRETLAINAINRRIAAISGTETNHGEALNILRYRPGQEFRLHADVLPMAANQRIKTVLVYLNDGFGGGETVFPAADLVVKPKAGDAIVFDNVLADGGPDPLARHAGRPVTRGVKWLATRWIRAAPHDPWTAR